MIVYAIRHKPTRNYMPTRMFKQVGSGWSWWEPAETCAGYMAHDKNPRLFFTLQSARKALAQWLRGPLSRQYVSSAAGYNLDNDERIVVHPTKADEAAKPRVRTDMEIVAFIVTKGAVIE